MERVSLPDLLEAIGTSIRTKPEDYEESLDIVVNGEKERTVKQIKPPYDKVLWWSSAAAKVFHNTALVTEIMLHLYRNEAIEFIATLPRPLRAKARNWLDTKKPGSYWELPEKERRMIMPQNFPMYKRKETEYEQKVRRFNDRYRSMQNLISK